jgi:hypothetical protein
MMRKINLKFFPVIVLSVILLVGIIFSVIQIIRASPAVPDPGHPWSEIECDTNLCVSTSTSNVGIGTTTPDPVAKLDVAGRGKMTEFQLGTSATAGSFLVADSSGVGSWADPIVTISPWSYPVYSAVVSASASAASKHHLVIYNGTGSGKTIDILEVKVSIGSTAAVTGIGGQEYLLYRTTTAGAGGTAVTPNKMDTTNADLPAAITIQTAPTTAPTLSTLVAVGRLNPEETGADVNTIIYKQEIHEQPLTLSEEQGITVQQYGTAGVGTLDVTIKFRVR